MYAARLPPQLSANSDTTQQYLYMQARARSVACTLRYPLHDCMVWNNKRLTIIS